VATTSNSSPKILNFLDKRSNLTNKEVQRQFLSILARPSSPPPWASDGKEPALYRIMIEGKKMPACEKMGIIPFIHYHKKERDFPLLRKENLASAGLY
jgi:hypothetical protein